MGACVETTGEQFQQVWYKAAPSISRLVNTWLLYVAEMCISESQEQQNAMRFPIFIGAQLILELC